MKLTFSEKNTQITMIFAKNKNHQGSNLVVLTRSHLENINDEGILT